MSTTYRPTPPRGLPEEARAWMETELQSIKKAMEAGKPFETLVILHAAPVRTHAGMVCYFDGTDYNPGSGQGVYVRDKANAAWRFLG